MNGLDESKMSQDSLSLSDTLLAILIDPLYKGRGYRIAEKLA